MQILHHDRFLKCVRTYVRSGYHAKPCVNWIGLVQTYTISAPPLILFQATAFLSLGVVVISTVCFILSTFPELQDDYESVDYDDTSATAQTAEFVILVTDNATEDSGDTFHGLDLENLFEWPEVNYSEVNNLQ